MLRSVYLNSLSRHRRALIGWAAGMAAVSCYVMLLYPAVHGSASQITEFIDQLPAGIRAAILGDMPAAAYSSAAGYVQSELFSLMTPLLFLVFAIAYGSRAVAGNEEAGELELALATPLPRRALVLGEVAALATGMALLSAVLWVVLTLAALAVGASLDAWATLQAAVSAWLFGVMFGAVALAAGCVRGRRGAAIAAASALAVAAYLFNALAQAIDGLHAFRILSPFQWYLGGFLLRDGLEPGRVAALVVTAAIALGAALLALQRRDVGV